IPRRGRQRSRFPPTRPRPDGRSARPVPARRVAGNRLRTRKRATPMRKRTVLLTGGSGVLGRALVDELVEDFDVICVRHRKPVADLRVGTVTGDLSRAGLGLAPADLDRLLRRVDVILHSAANTSWRASREDIFATNVGGTATMLGLAERAQAPIYFMSTAFVARVDHTGDDERFGGAAAYLASKIEAGQAVRDSGVPGPAEP